MALAAQLIFLFIFRAAPSTARPVWPTSAQAGPSLGRHLHSATEATAALPSHSEPSSATLPHSDGAEPKCRPAAFTLPH
jgi:hypothetical protein